MPKPSAPSGLKVYKTDIDYIEFRWNEGKCTGYDIQYKKSEYDGKQWRTLKRDYDKNRYVLQSQENEFDIVSNTSYDFRVRAVNHNTAGKSTSKWVKITGKTDLNTNPRKISCIVYLPMNGNVEDVLTVTYYGYNEKDKKYNKKLEGPNKYKVNLRGQSVKIPETEKKYTGKIRIVFRLKKQKLKEQIITDSELAEVYIDDGYPQIIDGGED